MAVSASSIYVTQVRRLPCPVSSSPSTSTTSTKAVAFYSKLFNAEPAKLKAGYANFAVTEPPLKLVLLENPGHGGTINHLGVEVESSDKVHAEIARLTGEGMFTEEEIGTTCCFATPRQGVGDRTRRREVGGLHRLADSETFGTSPELLAADEPGGCSCAACDSADAETVDSASSTSSCC